MKKKDSRAGYVNERRFLFSLTIALIVLMVLFWESSLFIRLAFGVVAVILLYLFDGLFRMGLKRIHYAAYVIIIISGVLMSPLFYIYPYYDKVLHFFLPILTSFLVFYCVNKLDIKLRWKILFTFSIVVAILGIFEIVEYTLDLLLDMKLQGVYLRDSYGIEKLSVLTDPLDDTMVDMVFGTLGSLVYCGYVYFKYKN